jgi:signal transduction histidine kinase
MRGLSKARYLFKKTSKLFSLLVASTSDDRDKARREFVLNIILLGILLLTGSALVLNIISFLSHTQSEGAIHPYLTAAFFFLLLLFYQLSKMGKAKLVSIVFIFVWLLVPFYTQLRWGDAIPIALLAYALIIVISGILIHSQFAFIATLVIIIFNFVSIYLHQNNIIIPDYSWRDVLPDVAYVVLMQMMFALIAVLSWLFNNQSDIAFKQSEKMERALEKERDLLEQKVEERTREIKKVQIEQTLQLRHMAEIGRLTSGIFHDLVNPLNLVSLNLSMLHTETRDGKKNSQNRKVLVNRAMKGIKHLTKFVMMARKQIQETNTHESYRLSNEIRDVISMLDQKAKEAKVPVIFTSNTNCTFYGNPLRFNQIVMNLISNAIDSYDGLECDVKEKEVTVSLEIQKQMTILTVSDKGCGMSKDILGKIFDPFFTTKKLGKGIGIGLTIVKEIIQKELNGDIKIESDFGKGTKVTVHLPILK